MEGIKCMLVSLKDVINSKYPQENGQSEEKNDSEQQAPDVLNLRLPIPPASSFPLSPASTAFAEVLMCEIALKNKDRLGSSLWQDVLEPHYISRLANIAGAVSDRSEGRKTIICSATEKCVTGLLRLCACTTNKDIADDTLGLWCHLLPSVKDLPEHSLLGILDKQVGGGLWRIANNVDGYSQLGEEGWAGLFLLTTWCAERGGQLPPLHADGLSGEANLSEDDPALQAYRSLHLMLNAEDVRNEMPYSVVETINAVVAAGERRSCSQLSIASLDLLQSLVEHKGTSVLDLYAKKDIDDAAMYDYWILCWKASIEVMAFAVEAATLSVG